MVQPRLIDATEANLLTFWDGRVEDAASVARKTDATIQRLGAMFPVDGWRYPNGREWGMWPSTPSEQTAWVASKVFTSQDGVPEPISGFSLPLSQEVHGLYVKLRIEAGSSIRGGRVPANRVSFTLEERVPGSLDIDAVDPIIDAIVDVWEPLAGNFRDRAVITLARPTSLWQVPIGHRIWLHETVASIDQAAPGVTISRRETGTLLAVPDDWTAPQVVEAMSATLSMNNIDIVPHDN